MGNAPPKGTPWFIVLASAVRECQLAATHGPYVSMLVLMVANIQDQTRRQGLLVPIYAAQLMPAIGVRQHDSFRNIRHKAIDAGWLTYQTGGTRAAGKYAAHIPQDYPGEIGSMAYVVPREILGVMPSEMPPNSRPSPIPTPDKAAPSGAEEIIGMGERPRRQRQPPSNSTEDADLARFVWDLIHKMQPTRKQPNLDKWANDIRLMREADKRTPDEIRKLFRWANADTFWKSNILSPDKLRSKWDDLALRMQNDRKTNQPAGSGPTNPAKPINANSKYHT